MQVWQTGLADKAYLLIETIQPVFGMSQVTLTHAHCRSTQPNLASRSVAQTQSILNSKAIFELNCSPKKKKSSTKVQLIPYKMYYCKYQNIYIFLMVTFIKRSEQYKRSILTSRNRMLLLKWVCVCGPLAIDPFKWEFLLPLNCYHLPKKFFSIFSFLIVIF